MKTNWIKALAVVVLIAAVGLAVPAQSATKAVSTTTKKSVTKAKADPKKDNVKAKPVAAKALPKFLDLGSTTCIPCKMMVPVLDQLKKEYAGQLEVQFINVKEDSAAVKKYGIQSIPTQIIFDSKGKEVWRHVGFIPKEDVLKAFKDKGIKLTPPAPKPAKGTKGS
jgi:thioredoxin 1